MPESNPAASTAATHLQHAVREIDQELVAGYAAAHPELIAAFMQTAASESRNWSQAVNTAKKQSQLRD